MGADVGCRTPGRAGTGVRRRLKAQRREVLRLYAKPLITFAAIWVPVAAVLLRTQRTDFLRGLWLGISLAVLVGMPLYVLAFNGLMQRGMGADAEEWTEERLSKLDPRRWWAIHGLFFDRMDVDHVLVGSRRVFVIETKWCSFATRVEQRLPQAVWQAKWGAQRVAALLRSEGVARSVTPVVIVWGPSHRIGGETMVERDGVLIAVGKGVDDLLAELGRRCGSFELDPEPRRALEAFAARQAEWLARAPA